MTVQPVLGTCKLVMYLLCIALHLSYYIDIICRMFACCVLSIVVLGNLISHQWVSDKKGIVKWLAFEFQMY